jgi:hypothetical protein
MKKLTDHIDNFRYGFYHAAAFAIAAFILGLPPGMLLFLVTDAVFGLEVTKPLLYGWCTLVGFWGMGYNRNIID